MRHSIPHSYFNSQPVSPLCVSRAENRLLSPSSTSFKFYTSSLVNWEYVPRSLKAREYKLLKLKKSQFSKNTYRKPLSSPEVLLPPLKIVSYAPIQPRKLDPPQRLMKVNRGM
mmetsp:Transcript_29117/g.52092  ORF Transcript_29117/g.52092 Transcript_29117/m.52092 type:complete len:113 (+) Transcript_29117:98-436(+)